MSIDTRIGESIYCCYIYISYLVGVEPERHLHMLRKQPRHWFPFRNPRGESPPSPCSDPREPLAQHNREHVKVITFMLALLYCFDTSLQSFSRRNDTIVLRCER